MVRVIEAQVPPLGTVEEGLRSVVVGCQGGRVIVRAFPVRDHVLRDLMGAPSSNDARDLPAEILVA
eukprot:4688422-Alexandrium_andersonii.AAC.1